MEKKNTGKKIVKMKVYRDGTSVVGYIPSRSNFRRGKTDEYKKEMRAAFRKYYQELLRDKKASTKYEDILDELWCKMFTNEPQSYLLEREDIEEMIKYEKNRIYKKKKLLRQKLSWIRPNWFITFTYDSRLTDEESFSRKLRRCLVNLAYRNNWKIFLVPEYGSKGERKHYHALAEIPEGQMVGELYLDSRYNVKKKKRETFTNNTFFQERFGITCFEAITADNLDVSRTAGYIVKYLEKQDGDIFYSRHLSPCVEMDIDVEESVFLTFYKGFKKRFFLDLRLVYNRQELKALFADDFFVVDNEGMGYLDSDLSWRDSLLPAV